MPIKARLTYTASIRIGCPSWTGQFRATIDRNCKASVSTGTIWQPRLKWKGQGEINQNESRSAKSCRHPIASDQGKGKGRGNDSRSLTRKTTLGLSACNSPASGVCFFLCKNSHALATETRH